MFVQRIPDVCFAVIRTLKKTIEIFTAFFDSFVIRHVCFQ